MKDIQLINNGYGLWEPSLAYTDADHVDGFETAILVSLFTNARADESERSDPLLRGGWWGNQLNSSGFELGSRNWLFEREKITNNTTKAFKRYSERSLKWILESNAIQSMTIAIRPNIKIQTYIIVIFMAGRITQYNYSYDWGLTNARKIAKNIRN